MRFGLFFSRDLKKVVAFGKQSTWKEAFFRWRDTRFSISGSSSITAINMLIASYNLFGDRSSRFSIHQRAIPVRLVSFLSLFSCARMILQAGLPDL